MGHNPVLVPRITMVSKPVRIPTDHGSTITPCNRRDRTNRVPIPKLYSPFGRSSGIPPQTETVTWTCS